MSAAEFMAHFTKLILEKEEEKISWTEEQHHILRVLMEYANTLPYTPTRWDALYFCVAEFGEASQDHIDVINYLYKQRILFS